MNSTLPQGLQGDLAIMGSLCDLCPPRFELVVVGLIDVAPTRNILAALRNRNTLYKVTCSGYLAVDPAVITR